MKFLRELAVIMWLFDKNKWHYLYLATLAFLAFLVWTYR
jgi:hypothetical protein